jgi:hypothetical protein
LEVVNASLGLSPSLLGLLEDNEIAGLVRSYSFGIEALVIDASVQHTDSLFERLLVGTR